MKKKEKKERIVSDYLLGKRWCVGSLIGVNECNDRGIDTSILVLMITNCKKWKEKKKKLETYNTCLFVHARIRTFFVYSQILEARLFWRINQTKRWLERDERKNFSAGERMRERERERERIGSVKRASKKLVTTALQAPSMRKERGKRTRSNPKVLFRQHTQAYVNWRSTHAFICTRCAK